MNIMKTQLLIENGKYYVTPFGSKIEVDGENGALLKEKEIKGGEIILGVRPEHIVLADESAENTINGSVMVNEMMGSELHLHVEEENGDRLIVRIPTIVLTDEQRASIVYDSLLHVTCESKVMHFFDPETEMNLLA